MRKWGVRDRSYRSITFSSSLPRSCQQPHVRTLSVPSAMAQVPLHLPQELVDSIIAYVDDDRATLVSCAQVSRSWLHSSRHYLFANISLSPHSSGKSLPQVSCQRLYRVLQDSPAIIQYIRHLQIVDGGSSPNVPTRQWITSERSLPPLLKLLTHLRQLELGASSPSSPLQWKSLPFTLQNAICTVLKLPTLSFVRLHTWTFPNLVSLAAVISSCQNLKGLSLSSVTVDEELHHHSEPSGQTKSITLPPPPTTQLSPPLLVSSANSDHGRYRHSTDTEGLGIDTEFYHDHDHDHNEDDPGVESGSDTDTVNTRVRQPHLEALSLDYVNFGYLGYWLFAPSQSPSPINFATLRELRISRSADPLVVEQILISIGASLEYLHLKPGSWDVFSFDLKRNPNLKSLRLTLEKSETALSWCTTLLSSLAPSGFFSSSSSSSSSTYSGYSDDADELSLSHISLEFWTDLKKLSAASTSSSSSASSTASSSLSNSPNRSTPSLLPSSSPPTSSSPLSSSSALTLNNSSSASLNERAQTPLPRQRRSFTLYNKLEPTWSSLDSILSFLPTPLHQLDVGLFAQSTSADFLRVKEALRGVRTRLNSDCGEEGEERESESDCDDSASVRKGKSGGVVRVYQLGLKSQRSIGRICGPRLRSFEGEK